jgi:hypothetical protein
VLPQSVPKGFQQNLSGEQYRDSSAAQDRRQNDATFVDESPANGAKSWLGSAIEVDMAFETTTR